VYRPSFSLLAGRKERKKVGRCLSATAIYAFVELKTVGIIHLVISGKAFELDETRRAKKGKFLEDSTDRKSGKNLNVAAHASRKHHTRKRKKKRRLLVYFIPYFSSFLSSS
jgi:hypothetical protein